MEGAEWTTGIFGNVSDSESLPTHGRSVNPDYCIICTCIQCRLRLPELLCPIRTKRSHWAYIRHRTYRISNSLCRRDGSGDAKIQCICFPA